MSDLADWLPVVLSNHVALTGSRVAGTPGTTVPLEWKCVCGWHTNAAHGWYWHDAHRAHVAAAVSEAFLGLPLQERARLAGIELSEETKTAEDGAAWSTSTWDGHRSSGFRRGTVSNRYVTPWAVKAHSIEQKWETS